MRNKLKSADGQFEGQQFTNEEFCFCSQNDRYYAATENNAILVFTFKEGDPEGIIMRFTLPVTHMCFNKDGSKLLAGARYDYVLLYSICGQRKIQSSEMGDLVIIKE